MTSVRNRMRHVLRFRPVVSGSNPLQDEDQEVTCDDQWARFGASVDSADSVRDALDHIVT